ncbi:MAG: MFS transporter [Rubrobacteraceae bacterium]
MASDTRAGFRRYVPRGHPVSWWMLGITTGAILITSIDRVILPTVLPAILKEFNLSTSQGGLLVSLSFAGIALGGIFLGAMGDSLGRGPRRAWTWGVAVLIAVVAAIATALSRSLFQLQALRVFMGLGTGSMEPVNVAMVGEWWQKEDRGFAVGTHHTGFPIGQFLGPLLIGAILIVGTWRTAFLFIPLIAVPILILQVVFANNNNLRRVNDWIKERDMTPSVTVEQVEGQRWKNPFGEIRTALSYRNIRLAILMNFLFLFAEVGILSFLTLQLTQKAGLSLAAASVVSGASGITGWIGQIVWGTVSDYRGRKFSLGILSIGLTISTLAMIFITSAALGWIILIFWGIFRNSPYPVLYSAVIDTAPDTASTGMGLMIGVGLGVAGTIVGFVAGYVIQTFGFTVDYILLAAVYLSTLIPIALMRESAPAATPNAAPSEA